MPLDLQKKGQYELFLTTKGHQILVLNNSEWYAWVEGQKGEILVASDADHQKDRAVQKGLFYYVDFQDDPNYRDVPHLFLAQDDRFQELILPKGFPSPDDKQKPIIRSDETVEKKTLEEYLKHPADS